MHELCEIYLRNLIKYNFHFCALQLLGAFYKFRFRLRPLCLEEVLLLIIVFN